LTCECYNNIPEIENNVCINCGKMFNIEVIFEEQKNFKEVIIPETKDYSFIVEFIESKLGMHQCRAYNQEIIEMYTIVVNKYKSLNNLSKIKEKGSFAYLSCWYILKFHLEWDLCNKLIVYKNEIKNTNLNKANKIFYILTREEFKLYSGVILYENYKYLIFKLLQECNYLHLFDKIFKIYILEFEKDKFNSEKNIKDFIINCLSIKVKLKGKN
jgi:hypothetical protein